MLCHVSDVLQGFLEGVQRDLRSDPFLLIEHLKRRSVVVVRQLQFELRVGRTEVVLGVLGPERHALSADTRIYRRASLQTAGLGNPC